MHRTVFIKVIVVAFGKIAVFGVNIYLGIVDIMSFIDGIGNDDGIVQWFHLGIFQNRNLTIGWKNGSIGNLNKFHIFGINNIFLQVIPSFQAVKLDGILLGMGGNKLRTMQIEINQLAGSHTFDIRNFFADVVDQFNLFFFHKPIQLIHITVVKIGRKFHFRAVAFGTEFTFSLIEINMPMREMGSHSHFF